MDKGTLIWLILGGLLLYTVGLVLLVECLVRHAGRSTVTGDPLQTEKVNGKRQLLRDFEVTFEREKIVVPKGFVTDYSSIPWFGRGLVRWSTVDVAGVVHDYLYWIQRNRKEADRIWRKIAGSGPVYATCLQRWICWLALRVGGWWAYRKHRTGSGPPPRQPSASPP